MSKSNKMNKSQTAALAAATVASILSENADLCKKDKAPVLADLLTTALLANIGPKTGGGISNKVNDAGDVWCNYFEEYLPAADFNQKLGKPNKDGDREYVYKANCKAAEQIIRKIKNIKKRYQDQQVQALVAKHITADEMEANLAHVDARYAGKFQSLADVPELAEVIGLTGEEA